MPVTLPLMTIPMLAAGMLIAFLLPIVLLVLARKKLQTSLMPAITGAAIYFLFVLLLESHFSALLLQQEPLRDTITSGFLPYTLYLALLSVLFEETGRLLAFYVLLRNPENDNLYGTLSYGIGQGGAEAVITGGLPLLSNLVFALTVQHAGPDAVLMMAGGEQAAEAAELAIDFLATYPSSYFLAAGLERIPSMGFHIALSVLLWMIASGRQPFHIFLLVPALRVLYHLPGGLFQFDILANIWIAELLLTLICTGICYIVWRMYRTTPFLTPQNDSENKAVM